MKGKRIRELRLARGWDQEKLARKAGVHPQTVSNWECDRHKPGGATVKLLEVLLIDVN